MLHRGARSAIEFAGNADFLSAAGPALARPTLDIGGIRHELSDVPIAWERALGWIPTFTCSIADLVLRGTIFAPYGRDADVSGAVYALSIENRGSADVVVDVVAVRHARTPSGARANTTTVRGRQPCLARRVGCGVARGLIAAGARCDGDRRRRRCSRVGRWKPVFAQAIDWCASRRARAGRVLSRRRPRTRRRRGNRRCPASSRLARAPLGDARCAPESRAGERQRGDGPADQSQSFLRVLLRRRAARWTTRSTISCARACRGTATA